MAQMASLKVLSFQAVTTPEATSGLSIFHAACIGGNEERIASIIFFSPSKLDTIVGLNVKSLVKSGEKWGGKTPEEILVSLGTSSHLKAVELVRETIRGFQKRPFLHLAARVGSIWHCDRLIKEGADVNEISTFEEDSYSTPLNIAIAHNTEAVVNYLIREGADVSKPDGSELNAIHYAAMKGTSSLLNRLMGANQNLEEHEWNGFSLLHLAACCGNIETMTMLVHLGTDVNTTSRGRSRHDLFPPGLPSKYMDGCGITPLMCAATQGHLAAVDFLIQRDADVNKVNNEYECNALFFAAECGHTDVVRTLLPHMSPEDIHVKDNCGRTALHEAKLPKIVELLVQNGLCVNEGDIDGCTPLHYAAREKNFGVTKKLLQYEADIDAEDGVGKTPLFHVLDADENLDVISFFVENGSSTTHKNKYGDTPLHRAIHLGYDTTKYFLDHGAHDCINTLGAYKQSPLHIAAKMDYRITELLLKSGADANLTDRMGPSPIASAVASNQADIVRLLVEYGGDVNLLCCKRYVGKGESTVVPLHIAVQEANIETVKQLLELGAVVNSRDVNNKTPLHYATMLRKADAFQISRFLLEHGADPNVSDSDCDSTALHLAAGQEDGSDLLKLLLENDGDVQKTDKGGNIPLHLAVSKGCLQNVQLLVERGSDVNQQNFKWSTSLTLANTALKNRQQIKELLVRFDSCKI